MGTGAVGQGIQPVDSPIVARRALTFLQAIERTRNLPPADEAELARLADFAGGTTPGESWSGLVFLAAGTVSAYCGLTTPADEAPMGDVAWTKATSGALLLEEVAAECPTAQLWIRGADGEALDIAESAGWRRERSLVVMACELGPSRLRRPGRLPGGFAMASWEAVEVDAIAQLLRAAYGQGGDGDWDADEIRWHAARGWFRPEDVLLVQVADGTLAAILWLKRRDATTGEIHNLALHPRQHGKGLASSLLDLGIDHLAQQGMERILLWAAEDNEPARRLYASRDFEVAWTDVAISPGR